MNIKKQVILNISHKLKLEHGKLKAEIRRNTIAINNLATKQEIAKRELAKLDSLIRSFNEEVEIKK